MSEKKNATPGEGLRSVRTTTLFKAVNFELYVKPVSTHLNIPKFN